MVEQWRKIMNTFLKGLMAIAVVSLPGAAFAQSSDAAYCKALVNQYERYLDSGLRLGEQPQSLESKASLVECRAGDPRGIPGLERALRDARLTLPARNSTSAAATATDKKCGPETWSTDQMMYVGVPCENQSTYEGSK
jgi:hypothetical protein